MNIKYPFILSEVPIEEDGGYCIEYPDLPGCKCYGDTKEETILNGEEAVKAWLAAAHERGDEIPILPEGDSILIHSGRWVQRAPKSLHADLAVLAKAEGVSLNTLVISLLTEGVAIRKHSLSPQTAQRPQSLISEHHLPYGKDSYHAKTKKSSCEGTTSSEKETKRTKG